MKYAASIAMAMFTFAAAANADIPQSVATNCARMARLATGGPGGETGFDVIATFISHGVRSSDSFCIEDASGAVGCVDRRDGGAAKVAAGDGGRFTGVFLREGDETYVVCTNFELLSHGPVPEVRETTAERFLSGAEDYRAVRLHGIVRDAFRDENDPRFIYFPLLCDGEVVYAALMSPPGEELKDLVGAEIVATGRSTPLVHNNRKHIGRTLQIGTKENIRVLKPASEDPFGAPELGFLRCEHPARIALLGRRRAVGRVLATWGGNRFLLRMDRERIANITLADPNLPGWGDEVEVVGFPETDLYRINLVRAIWRPALRHAPVVPCPQTPNAASPRAILYDEQGQHRIDPLFHGRAIRIKGRVASLPEDDGERLFVESDGCTVPVELPAGSNPCDSLSVGCVVELRGVCVMETENWRPNAAFPCMKGFFLVVRPTDGIRVVSRPSWWTAPRLAFVVFVLALAVVAVLVWNRQLRRLAERRGRELAAGDIARAEADVRTMERTRLAVELHDSVAQNLSGATMELEAAARCAAGATPELARHLDIAWRTLKSTLVELRNCLWDLRSQSLEEKDFAEAVRRTLQPHTENVSLAIRFSVPRECVTDSTAHTILRIIRELVINAVKHGKAKSIKVAGAVEGREIKFSVADDGCGFDTESRPGVAEGHFGIQGIRERVRLLAGSVSFDSAPGRGTKATVTIGMPREDV